MKQPSKKSAARAATVRLVTRDRLVEVTGGGGHSTITANKDGIDVVAFSAPAPTKS